MCIEIKMGQKILGCLQVLSAVSALVGIIQNWGAYGAWGLVNVPLMLCSCFNAFRYVQWFGNQDSKTARSNLVQGCNAQIIGWCVTYTFCCIMVTLLSHQSREISSPNS